jgi:hypothetical protein
MSLAINFTSFLLMDPMSLGSFYTIVSTFIVRNLNYFSNAFCFCSYSKSPSSLLNLLLIIKKFFIIFYSKRVILSRLPVIVISYSTVYDIDNKVNNIYETFQSKKYIINLF